MLCKNSRVLFKDVEVKKKISSKDGEMCKDVEISLIVLKVWKLYMEKLLNSDENNALENLSQKKENI